jgi:hypothetical protein
MSSNLTTLILINKIENSVCQSKFFNLIILFFNILDHLWKHRSSWYESQGISYCLIELWIAGWISSTSVLRFAIRKFIWLPILHDPLHGEYSMILWCQTVWTTQLIELGQQVIQELNQCCHLPRCKIWVL